MHIYDENGYANMGELLKMADTPFLVAIGGRGIGKTYGIFKYLIYEERKPFIYMRRKQDQIDIAASAVFSPFAPMNKDFSDNIVPKALTKKSYGYYRVEDGKEDELIAVSMGLTTIANQRGFDASSFEFLVFDEVVPEAHERKIKNEGLAFLNAYETFNRNRELKGEKPLKAILIGNSNVPDSDILCKLGLEDLVDKMRRRNREMYKTDDITVFKFPDSPISQKKRKTAIYRVAADDDFLGMALDNEFSKGVYEHVIDTGLNLKEYKPLAAYEKLRIYQHKHDARYYVTQFQSGTFNSVFSRLPTERKQFIKLYTPLLFAYENGLVKFDKYENKRAFLAIFE